MLAPTLRDTHPCAPDTHFSLAACASRAGLAPTNPLQGERKLRTKRGSEGAGEGEGKELGLWTVRGMPQCFCMNLTSGTLASSRVIPSYDTHLVLRRRARLSQPPSKCIILSVLFHQSSACASTPVVYKRAQAQTCGGADASAGMHGDASSCTCMPVDACSCILIACSSILKHRHAQHSLEATFP